ncbi:hypothetical protein ONZ51_g1050 [Trametes cubensis]|uniref:Uncharacterized protein n=1 Tax=Trametes cubensis TaxID=1111947 RepID=A0AAD7U283_9APHY|nr:hypothetical protein ONZ51_g1050 [Trametes cubensis]
MGSSADLNLASCFGVVASVAGYIFELDERCIGDIPRPFFCTVEAKTSVELEDKIPFIRELADLYGDSFPSEGPVVDREGTISPALTSARDMILQVWAQVWSGRPPLGILCDENVFYCFQMDGQDTLYMQGPMAICALPGALSLSPHQQLTPERFVTALATAYFVSSLTCPAEPPAAGNTYCPIQQPYAT